MFFLNEASFVIVLVKGWKVKCLCADEWGVRLRALEDILSCSGVGVKLSALAAFLSGWLIMADIECVMHPSINRVAGCISQNERDYISIRMWSLCIQASWHKGMVPPRNREAKHNTGCRRFRGVSFTLRKMLKVSSSQSAWSLRSSDFLGFRLICIFVLTEFIRRE